jgi:hypothetical protein
MKETQKFDLRQNLYGGGRRLIPIYPWQQRLKKISVKRMALFNFLGGLNEF